MGDETSSTGVGKQAGAVGAARQVTCHCRRRIARHWGWTMKPVPLSHSDDSSASDESLYGTACPARLPPRHPSGHNTRCVQSPQTAAHLLIHLPSPGTPSVPRLPPEACTQSPQAASCPPSPPTHPHILPRYPLPVCPDPHHSTHPAKTLHLVPSTSQPATLTLSRPSRPCQVFR